MVLSDIADGTSCYSVVHLSVWLHDFILTSCVIIICMWLFNSVFIKSKSVQVARLTSSTCTLGDDDFTWENDNSGQVDLGRWDNSLPFRALRLGLSQTVDLIRTRVVYLPQRSTRCKLPYICLTLIMIVTGSDLCILHH